MTTDRGIAVSEFLWPRVTESLTAGLVGPKLTAGLLGPKLTDSLTAGLLGPKLTDSLTAGLLGPKLTAGLVGPKLTAGLLGPKLAAGLVGPELTAGLLGPKLMGALTAGLLGPKLTDSLTAGLVGRILSGSLVHSAVADRAVDDSQLLVVDDAETAETLLDWLKRNTPSSEQAAHVCDVIALANAIAAFAEYRAGLKFVAAITEFQLTAAILFAILALVLRRQTH